MLSGEAAHMKKSLSKYGEKCRVEFNLGHRFWHTFQINESHIDDMPVAIMGAEYYLVGCEILD